MCIHCAQLVIQVSLDSDLTASAGPSSSTDDVDASTDDGGGANFIGANSTGKNLFVGACNTSALFASKKRTDPEHERMRQLDQLWGTYQIESEALKAALQDPGCVP